MDVLLHWITYASLAIFVGAVFARFRRIQSYPLHLRWELYPVPHEGERSKHGGSILEETDWWTKERRPSMATELKFMLPEMIFIKALWEHNRKLWYRSFPFHFGLYLVCGFAGLLVLSALLEIFGVSFAEDAGALGSLLSGATVVLGISGLVLGIIGGIGLIHMRATDSDLRPYTNFSHFFNLGFITAALILLLAVWVGDRDFSALRGYVGSLLVLDLSYSAESALVSLTVLATSLLIAYVPLTHMSHFFVKWFTWHKIRWDDEPNVKGGRFEVMIEEALKRPVTWAAEHVNADGRKNWADIATEEIEK